jgi:hypothetical protein
VRVNNAYIAYKGSDAVSNTSGYCRNADQYRRRWGATGTGVGIAIGGAMAAAFVSMGTASADGEVAPENDGFTELALVIDPNAFTSTGAPNDFIGTLASQFDTSLANTVFGPEVDTIADQIFCAEDATCEPTLVITPPATGDDGFTVLEQFLANTYIPEIIPAVLAPSLDSDLATIASELDAYFAPTVFGPEWFTIASQIVAGL